MRHSMRLCIKVLGGFETFRVPGPARGRFQGISRDIPRTISEMPVGVLISIQRHVLSACEIPLHNWMASIQYVEFVLVASGDFSFRTQGYLSMC